MKNLFSILFTLFVAFSLNAQITVMEGSKTMSEGTYNAYTVILENIKESTAEDAWKDFVKDFKGKVKKDKKTRLTFSDNVQMPNISANPVDLYASLIENKGNSTTTVSVWFDTGSGYVNSIDMPTQSEIASDLVKEYGIKVMRAYSEKIQEEEEKILKSLTKDAKNLDDKNKGLINDIAKAKTNILKWEKELDQNEDDIKKKGKEIQNQTEVVSDAKSNTRKY